MKSIHFSNSEYAFAEIVWDNEPIHTRELVKICAERFEWKSTTTYTILRRLCDKSILKTDASIVTSLLKREDFQRYSSQKIVSDLFAGSLPDFIVAFTGNSGLSDSQIEELEKLLDTYREAKQ